MKRQLFFYLKHILVLSFVFLQVSIFADSGLIDEPQFRKALNRAVESMTTPKRLTSTANHKMWWRLMHYRKKWWGGTQSEADDKDFFISAKGKTHPYNELVANLKAFYLPATAVEDINKHSICRFPARWKWLRKRLRLSPSEVKLEHCPGYKDFLARTSAVSASLVFSSYYVGNPSSTFGHTLIRLNKTDPIQTKKHQRFELLDNGINYAANPWSRNPILYALGGVFGWFQGSFSMVPYHLKVREYNDYESRDIWSYELRMTKNQVARLVDHFWELGQIHFDYFYFDENCSYHMLTALEVALPKRNFISNLPPSVIPADTMKAVWKEKNFVRAIHYRPSARAKFFHQFKDLNAQQKGILRQIENKKDINILKNLADDEQALILDAAIEFVEYQNPEDIIKIDTESAAWKQKLLFARAKVPTISGEVQVPKPESEMPHVGHGSRRVSFAAGTSQVEQDYLNFEFRPSLHQILDREEGYLTLSEVTLGRTEIKYIMDNSKFEIENFEIRAVSLYPWDEFNRNLSWRVYAGVKRLYDTSCDFCHAGVLEYGKGFTFELMNRFYSYAMFEGQIAASKAIHEGNVRVAGGPRLGFLYLPNTVLRFELASFYYHLPFVENTKKEYWQTQFDIQYNKTKEYSLYFSYRLLRNSPDGQFGMRHFF